MSERREKDKAGDDNERPGFLSADRLREIRGLMVKCVSTIDGGFELAHEDIDALLLGGAQMVRAISAIAAELARARETSAKLNRRVQKAEQIIERAARDPRSIPDPEARSVDQVVALFAAQRADIRRLNGEVEKLSGCLSNAQTAIRRQQKEIAAARVEGAREERERIETALVDMRDAEDVSDQVEDTFCQALAIVRNAEGDLSPAEHAREAAIEDRARGEGRQG